MTTTHLPVDILNSGQKALTMAGRMRTHSTRELHTHACHQMLIIGNGISLLVDETRRQPLFGHMAALIPAKLPHRSVVIGDAVRYKSLYLSPALLNPPAAEIIIFNISPLGAALFDQIDLRHPQDIERGLNGACLDLLLKILPEDATRPVDLVRLPEARQSLNREVIAYIETHYARPLTLSDISANFPYSERHLSRRFKADLKITLFEYLRLYRTLIAAIELCRPDRTITEIAFDCGYESLSSFYRDFKLVFAVTPKSFRRGHLYE